MDKHLNNSQRKNVFVLPHSPLTAWGCKSLYLPTGVRILLKYLKKRKKQTNKKTKYLNREELRRIKQISVSAKMAKEAGDILYLTVEVVTLIPVFTVVKK